MKTFTATPDDIDRKWWLIDASGQTLGRLATRVATLLQGKHKPTFEKHMDMGDAVIVVNAQAIGVTGKKEENKKYHRHTGYPGGLRTASLKEVREKHPERILMTAVKGMLPRGPLGRDMLSKLKVYAGAEHPHAAQQPETIEDKES